MDFFATGGFQQLFNDLDDEQKVDFEPETGTIKMMPRDHFIIMKADDNDDDANNNNGKTKNNNVYSNNNCKQGFKNSNNNNNISANASPLNSLDSVYECLATSCERLSFNLTNTIDGRDGYGDFNNNNTGKKANLFNEDYENLHDNIRLESCLDFLLPLEDDYATATSLTATPAHRIQEVAEWEAQFLDNYIEIPELIEILPEKTPLCTDTCELFLHESSKNLRLSQRNRREYEHETTKRNVDDLSKGDTQAKSTSWIEAAAAVVGGICGSLPCTFGSCDKTYAKPAHLKAHLRRHLGEKPYICTWPECTWKFSRSDELARHRRSHSGVKPYKCEYCGKCFARSDHLAKHRKVHERRLLAANRAGRGFGESEGGLPSSVFNVRPGRKRKNQVC